MSKKSNMKGVIARMFTLVSERMRVHEAIQELIDNGIDAKAKNIDIKLDSVHNVFEYDDDGNGMNAEQVDEYANKYLAHMPTSDLSIGKFGAGSKDSIIKISDHINGSRTAIVTWPNKDEVSRINFIVDTNKEDDFRNPDINTTIDEKWVKEHGPHGHHITVKYIKDIDSSDKQWKSNLKKECSKAYACLINKYGINITINGEKFECVDRMHLDVLGDKVNDCGVHIEGNMVFIVKKYLLNNRKNSQDKRSVHVVYLYITKEGVKDDDNNYGFCGVYPILGERYLKVPKDNETGLPFAIGYRGGTGRCRVCIFVDGNEDIFALKSKKSDGIDITRDNIKLSKYRVANTDETFTQVFEKDFKILDKLASFQSDGGKNRVLTEEIAKRIVKGESLVQLEREYDGITPKEASQDKRKVTPTIAPTSVTKEEELEIKTQIDDELEAACKPIEELNNTKPVIELHVNKTTGKTEYEFTESKPKFCNDEYIDKLFNILMEEGLTKTKVIRICSKMAYSMVE